MGPIIKFNIVKDNCILYSNTCPLVIFSNLMPLTFYNMYDYIEILYENKKYKWYAVDYGYNPDSDVSNDEHTMLMSILTSKTWFSKYSVND